jgi:hypothetical protein
MRGGKAASSGPPSERERVSSSAAGRDPGAFRDARNWRLPSGKPLAEYALQGGFLAPLLLEGKTTAEEPQDSGGRLPGKVVGERGRRSATARSSR